jgi:hypothetical protein
MTLEGGPQFRFIATACEGQGIVSSSSGNGNAEGPGDGYKPASIRPHGSHSLPPPLPASIPAAPKIAVVDVTEAPPKRSSGFIVLALVVVVLAGVGGAFLKFKTSTEVVEVKLPPPTVAHTEPAPAPSPAPQPIAAAPVVEVSAQITSEKDPTVCIASHFPPKALGDNSDLGFVCTESDAWKIARQLEQRISKSKNEAGLALWSHLGMYELAVAASLRSSCCASAVPVEALAPTTPCGSLTEQLRALGPEPSAADLAKYEKLIHCLLDRNVRFPKEYTEVKGEAQRTAMKTYFPEAGGTDSNGAAGTRN